MSAAAGASADPLGQAIAWMLEAEAGDAWPEARRHAFEQWLRADPAHRTAWSKLEAMHATLRRLDAPARALARVRTERQRARRHALAVLATGGGALLAGAAALHAHRPLRALAADQGTATGETRRLALSDGSTLYMNARTVVDIDIGAARRVVRLLEGEILVQTAPDALRRPFLVETVEGAMQALGTRFLVEREAAGTSLTVLAHAVLARDARSGVETRVEAGQSLALGMGRGETQPARRDADAWLDGMLVAKNQPLGNVVRQLARHRPGRLAVDPRVAALPVSGTYSLRDTDLSLRALASQLPIRVRGGGWWVSIEPAAGDPATLSSR